jgi:hypothetical protein
MNIGTENGLGDGKLIASFYDAVNESGRAAQIRAGFEFANEIFDSFGLNITNISCACLEERANIQKHKGYSYREMKLHILEELEKGNLAYLHVSHVPNVQGAYAAYDWKVFIKIGTSTEAALASFQLGIDLDCLDLSPQGSTLDGLLGVSTTMSQIITAGYGFATIMPREFLPAGYTTGLAGRAPRKIVWDANSWARGAWKEFAARLRNVHGLNFVNRHHLLQKVGEQTLEEWITSSVDRGILTPWENNLHLWSFANTGEWPDFDRWDNPKIVSVRDELEQYDFFPWQQFVAKSNERHVKGSTNTAHESDER